MYPPTPTIIPDGIAPVFVNSEKFGIWEFAPLAVNMWNSWLGPTGTIVGQIAFILLIIVSFCALVYHWLNGISVDAGGNEFQ